MNCYSKEDLEQMLEDVINELNLSEGAIAKHGPFGTPAAELVRLVLAQKDQTIKMLRQGFREVKYQENVMGIGKRVLLKSVVSRKNHQCDMCGDTIEPGEHYTATTFISDDNYVNWKCCLSHNWKSINQRIKILRTDLTTL